MFLIHERLLAASARYIERNGTLVKCGLFVGLIYPVKAVTSRHAVPKLLGTYEQELHQSVSGKAGVKAGYPGLDHQRLVWPWSIVRARGEMVAILKGESVDLAVCHMPWSLAMFGLCGRLIFFANQMPNRNPLGSFSSKQ
jgi:hypothetical protein